MRGTENPEPCAQSQPEEANAPVGQGEGCCRTPPAHQQHTQQLTDCGEALCHHAPPARVIVKLQGGGAGRQATSHAPRRQDTCLRSPLVRLC